MNYRMFRKLNIFCINGVYLYQVEFNFIFIFRLKIINLGYYRTNKTINTSLSKTYIGRSDLQTETLFLSFY